ncbi:hypothetical protein MF271_14365 [Deinococcus sp. KNUC1210]|uniref:hypothetical protein n=1 Tax=Deinococcus sp. KNUC1210 TaxID=2917691 RepID=UPI001EF12C6E|nr:hypothetical protein [Deinococcus sp. KNUC1210]ULH15125.1 hypothetical protein MF271_14365 [Deinococcus sp. KNUC1210]
MDASTHHQLDSASSALTLDVTPAPDPSALAPASAEPLLQLRILEHAGDPELQREHFKIFLTDGEAVQVQAILRLEEGDTGIDLLYPDDAPNWGMRIENLPDTGSRLTRLDVDSRLPTSDTVTITAQEASALATRIQAARQERAQTSAQIREDGDEGGQGSENDPTKVH